MLGTWVVLRFFKSFSFWVPLPSTCSAVLLPGLAIVPCLSLNTVTPYELHTSQFFSCHTQEPRWLLAHSTVIDPVLNVFGRNVRLSVSALKRGITLAPLDADADFWLSVCITRKVCVHLLQAMIGPWGLWECAQDSVPLHSWKLSHWSAEDS